MPISIYPPTLKSSQPAFVPETSYTIFFTLQKITQFSEIGHVQIRVVRQTNNVSVVNTATYPDGTIYKTPSQIMTHYDNGLYGAIILDSDLSEPWQMGQLYKVQMRFGLNPMYSSVSEFATWKQQQIDAGAFSEWSTVMVIKPINKPDIYIENAEAISDEEIISSERTEPTLTPLFFGICKPVISDKEIVDKYKFDLYKGEKTVNDPSDSDFIETSEWLQHTTVATLNKYTKFPQDLLSSVDQYRFSHQLENEEIYTVFYSTRTINGYESQAQPYVFMASRTYLAELTGIKLRVDSSDIYCKENGCINLYLTTNTPLSGSFVVTRTSEYSNYTVWEDLKYVTYSARLFKDEMIFQDFTIESGVKYKYAFQQENSAGLRTSPIYDEHNSSHYIDFEYSYLYHDRVQLRLMFNQKLSSFKHTILSSKQDTLGSKYPYLSRNGYANYAEFPISGLISFQMDPDQTFLQIKPAGFYYEDELAIQRDKFEEHSIERSPCAENTDTSNDGGAGSNYSSLTIDYNLTDNNIYVERKFREKVEQFLNDFNYKLYKSPTEGNIVVGLMNVSLTPNTTLGRMIYEFSATAYEVLDNTLENLNEFGIINIGQFEGLTSDDTVLSFGQISGIYTTRGRNLSTDIYGQIKEQEEVSIGGGYKLQLKRVRSIWVERYPDTKFKSELSELYAKQAELSTAGESTADVDAQIDELLKLRDAIERGWEDSTIIISVNGKNLIIAPHRLYSLTYPITTLEVVAADYPVIINYVCELRQIEDLSVGVVTAIDASRIWGQLAGVFTDTPDVIMEGYNYDYGPGEPPYRVYSNSDLGVVYDAMGNILVDNTNFNLYKTLNVYEVIKEETRKQVEFIYNIKDGFKENLDTGEWETENMRYSFSGIVSLEIEADPNTVLLIGKEEDGSDAIEIKIGNVGKYNLTPMENLVRYIVLKFPSYAIIDYKCLTTQMKIKRQEG